MKTMPEVHSCHHCWLTALCQRVRSHPCMHASRVALLVVKEGAAKNVSVNIQSTRDGNVSDGFHGRLASALCAKLVHLQAWSLCAMLW